MQLENAANAQAAQNAAERAKRDSDANARLLAAFQSAPARAVRTLRRDAHSEEPACWLHAESFCLSRREALPAEAKG